MSYIYDIVLNFQENYYNFFEWNRNDKIKNIIKIPLYRITDKDINNFKYNKIKISKDFLDKIIIDNKNYKKIICLVSNTKITIGLLFNEEGTLIKRSSLLFEEEDEANELAKKLSLTKINYLNNTKIKPSNKLRIEKEKKQELINYLINTDSEITLKYLYYEYYQKEPKQNYNIKKILLKELSKEWNKNQNNLYKIINKLTKELN